MSVAEPMTPHMGTNAIGSYRRALRRDPCAYCGKRSDEMELDHIQPRAAGGRDFWGNLTAACSGCNREKRTWTLLGFLGRRRWESALSYIGEQRARLSQIGQG